MNMDSNKDEDGNLIPVPHVGGHNHGMPILDMPDLKPEEKLYWEQYNTTTYFNFDETRFEHTINKSFLSYHTFMITTLTVVFYPILLLLNNTNNKWYLLMLITNYGFVISGMLSILIFHNQLARNHIHLYPNNCYTAMNWILILLLSVHLISAVVKKSTEFFLFGNNSQSENFDYEMLYMVPENDNSVNSSNFEGDGSTRLSGETHQGGDSRSNSNTTRRYSEQLHEEAMSKGQLNKLSQNRNKLYTTVYNIPMIKQLSLHFHRLFSFIFNSLNYLILFYLSAHCCVGLAIGNIFGTPKERIFNLLAHWIKGGVFIILGIVSLARYCGFGINKSWGWNLSILKKSDYYNEVTGKYNIPTWVKLFGKSGVSMEFIEVFLIFFYGSTNIFLEHLASEDGKWTAKDLQHVSIAFLYLGAGLCGLLVEHYMSNMKYKMAVKQYKNIIKENEHREISKEEIDDILVANPGFSLNPLGPFTIFWTGILMSKHEQASKISTAVHVQWGSLLSYGSPFRLLSMIYMLAFPCSEIGAPQRPFTEIIAAFCLIAGGLIFMESTDQVIEAMEYRGYTEMFTLNISLGFITIVMSWIIILFIFKDWLNNKQKAS
ncbi:hypothetical protein QEN19_003700 [Hanseniaspora menglaensis]